MHLCNEYVHTRIRICSRIGVCSVGVLKAISFSPYRPFSCSSSVSSSRNAGMHRVLGLISVHAAKNETPDVTSSLPIACCACATVLCLAAAIVVANATRHGTWDARCNVGTLVRFDMGEKSQSHKYLFIFATFIHCELYFVLVWIKLNVLIYVYNLITVI